MTCNLNSKIAQLLNQTPNLRTTGADLGCDLCSAYNYRGMINEETHNASQSDVSLCRRFLWRRDARARFADWR
jgi:hypothetical protein